MDLMPWNLRFIPGWDVHFCKFDRPTQNRVLKKIGQLKQLLLSRGLHSSRYKEEVGQYRVVIKIDESTRTRLVEFIGNHKQYEKWYIGRK